MYHSVGTSGSFFSVTPSEFTNQMEFLRRNYDIVSLEDVLSFVSGTVEFSRRSVAITFDDGYYDNFVNVYPYAKKYELPIAIFVASGYIGKEMSLGNVSLKMLSWKEIAEMSKDTVTIGAHTSSHPDLRRLDLNRAQNEIEMSKVEIERATGRPVNFFAYPKGAYNNALFNLLKSSGFSSAFQVGEGLVRKGDNPYELKRVSIDSSVNYRVFVAKLTTASEWYAELEKACGKLISFLSSLSGIVKYNGQ
jgi:peptidoglycan/xylan/chitin deacetylase (PgdA/CDA1 family)